MPPTTGNDPPSAATTGWVVPPPTGQFFTATITTTNTATYAVTFDALWNSYWPIVTNEVGLVERDRLARQAEYNARYQEERVARDEHNRRLYQEDQEEYEARQAEANARYEAELERQRTAEMRARDLLLAHLDEQQRADLAAHRWFEVISNLGRRWRIRTGDGLVANVDLIPTDQPGADRIASYCAHLPEFDPASGGSLPVHDNYLGQMLLLRYDEQRFIDVANLYHAPCDPAAIQRLPQRTPRRLAPLTEHVFMPNGAT